MSLKSHTPRRDAATPRTADETMCVIGDVTLIDIRLARLMRKPNAPCSEVVSEWNVPMHHHELTVMMEPMTNVESVLICPGAFSLGPKRSVMIPGSSPTRIRAGARTTALRRFVYQDKWRALPCTTSKLFLITTEWRAVIIELTTPNPTPIRETSVPSRKTPTKKPMVTTPQASRMRKEGRAWRRKKEVPTVKGRTIPRATW